MSQQKNRIWLEGAIVAALSMALSFIPLKFGPGFSISIGMFPLIVYAFRRGTKPALMSGLMWGLLHFVMGKAHILTVSQALIEYLLAYTFIGMAGVYSTKIKEAVRTNSRSVYLYLGLGTVVGIISRYVWHVIAGVIFWGKYAMWGLSPLMYSLVINGTSAVLTGLATYALLILTMKKNKKLLLPS